MTGPDIDQLEATATEAATTLLHVGAGHTKVWTPHELAKRGKAGIEAVSDLAARARDYGDYLHAYTDANERAEAAEADRDRLREVLNKQNALLHDTARRVAELEQVCEKAIRERRSLESKEDDWHSAYERSERRVAELEAALRGFVEFCETLAADLAIIEGRG